MHREDRAKGRGGGVLIAFQNKLLSRPCEKLDSECELVWTKIELSNAKDLFVGVFYRPPTDRTCLENLQISHQKLQNTNSIVCLCGDFNLPDISWEDNSVKPGGNLVSASENLIEIVNEAGLTQMNSSPTREKNLLDLYFTNNPTLVRQVKVRPGSGDHHSAIMVDSLIKPLVHKSVSKMVDQFHKGNLKDLNYELSEFRSNS